MNCDQETQVQDCSVGCHNGLGLFDASPYLLSSLCEACLFSLEQFLAH